jgi:hypothetical protein
VRNVGLGRLRRPWRVGLVVLSTVALVGQFGASAGANTPSPRPAPGSSGTRAGHGPGKATFGVGPADQKGLDGRSYLNYTTSPGARTSDHIAVTNYGTKPIKLTLYPADATAADNGSIGFAPRTAQRTDASRWITFNGGATTLELHLAARRTRVLPITVSVPDNATPGDHLAGVMASYQGLVIGKGGQHLKFEQRVALRALFRVSGDIKALLTIDNLHVTYHGTVNPFGTGGATVTYVVRNAGNVLLSGKQNVNITGLFGSTGSTNTLVRLPLMLPGARFPMRVEVRHVWPQLLMHARVTVTPLGVAGAANPDLASASASTMFWAIPWTLLALVALLIVAAGALVLWRRRVTARPAAHPAGPREREAAAVGET